MAYVYPTGWQDPDNVWSNEQAVSDGRFETIARFSLPPPGEWSGYLVVSFPSNWVDRGAIATQYPFSHFDIQIDRRVAGDWTNILERLNTLAGYFIFWVNESEFARVTDLRIRFRYVSGMAPGISFIRLWYECTGLLSPICQFIHGVGDFFDNLGNTIEPVFIIGEHLSSPFHSLAETLHNLGETCCEVSADLQDLLDTIEGGFTWEGFLGLLQQYAPVLYYLIVDPAGEILYLIGQAFGLTPYEAQTPETIVKALFERYFPELYLLWRDPGLWIQERVLPLIPELPDWLTDPVGWLRAVIEQTFPTLVALANDPVGWFLVQLTLAFDLEPWHTQSLEFLAKWVLETYFPTLYLLWRDPDGWIQEHVLPLIPELPDFLADPEVWLLETLGRLFADWVEFLKGLLDLLLEFLRDPGKWLGEKVIAWIKAMTPADEVYDREPKVFDWDEAINTAWDEWGDNDVLVRALMAPKWED